MNRRGFIGGLVGLAGLVVGAKVVPQVPQPVQPVTLNPTIGLCRPVVDVSSLSEWCNSAEGEQVFIRYLQRNQSLVKKISRGH